MHWSARYIGKPYQEADCAALAALVLKNEFNHDINLPRERPAGVFALSAQINHNQADFASPTDRPKEGDAVLMLARGRVNHVGIYCQIGAVAYVLHSLKNAGQCCLHKLTELNRYHLSVEGFYTWH